MSKAPAAKGVAEAAGSYLANTGAAEAKGCLQNSA